MGAFLFSYEIDGAGFVFDYYVLNTFLVFAVQRPVHCLGNADLEAAAFNEGEHGRGVVLLLGYGSHKIADLQHVI